MTADGGSAEADPPVEPSQAEATDAAEARRAKVLLGVFWLWAALLLVATVAQLFGLDAVLDVLDVKRWFAR